MVLVLNGSSKIHLVEDFYWENHEDSDTLPMIHHGFPLG